MMARRRLRSMATNLLGKDDSPKTYPSKDSSVSPIMWSNQLSTVVEAISTQLRQDLKTELSQHFAVCSQPMQQNSQSSAAPPRCNSRDELVPRGTPDSFGVGATSSLDSVAERSEPVSAKDDAFGGEMGHTATLPAGVAFRSASMELGHTSSVATPPGAVRKLGGMTISHADSRTSSKQTQMTTDGIDQPRSYMDMGRQEAKDRASLFDADPLLGENRYEVVPVERGISNRDVVSSNTFGVKLQRMDTIIDPERGCPYVSNTVRNIMDSIVGLAILFNSLLVGFETDYMARHHTFELPSYCDVLDLIFCTFFTVELVARIFDYRKDFLFGPEWHWNSFDFVMVLAQWSEKVGQALLKNLSSMRVLRLLRTLRLMRIGRLFRLIEEFRTIATCVLSSLKSFWFSAIFLFLTVYVSSVLLANIVLAHRVSVEATHGANAHVSAELDYWYGTLARTILTLFQSIASGVSWDECLNPLMTEVSPMVAFVFVLYIAFCMISMMNVITGVFVDAMLSNAEKANTEYLANRTKELFGLVDVDHSGFITWEEFESKLDDDELKEYFREIDVETSEAEGLFALIDADDNGLVDATEFVSACVRLRGPAKALDMALLMHEVHAMHHLIQTIDAQLQQRLSPVGS